MKAWEDRLTPNRPVDHAIGLETIPGTAEITTELRGERRPVGLSAFGQWSEGRHCHRLAANTTGQSFDQQRSGPDPFEIQETPTRPTEPVSEQRDHGGLVAWSGHQVEMIGSRPVPHHAYGGQWSAYLESKAAEESRVVHDQKKVAG